MASPSCTRRARNEHPYAGRWPAPGDAGRGHGGGVGGGVKPAYYNEIDPYAAQHLRNLIASGLIAPGDVDERSIEDVAPDDRWKSAAAVGGRLD